MKIENYDLEDSILTIYHTLPPKSQHIFLLLLSGKTSLVQQAKNKNYYKSVDNLDEVHWHVLGIHLYKMHLDLQKGANDKQ